MAFTSADVVRIFDRMGQARRFLSVDSALLQAIAAVGSDPDMQVLVISLLNECDRVDAKLKSAQGRLSIRSIDKNDVVFNPDKEIFLLRSEGRRYVARIARALGVPPRGDCFSGSLDVNVAGWAPLQGMYGPGYGGTGGNGMKLG